MHWVLIVLTFDPTASTAPVNVAMQEFGDEASCLAAGGRIVDTIGQLPPKFTRAVKVTPLDVIKGMPSRRHPSPALHPRANLRRDFLQTTSSSTATNNVFNTEPLN